MQDLNQDPISIEQRGEWVNNVLLHTSQLFIPHEGFFIIFYVFLFLFWRFLFFFAILLSLLEHIDNHSPTNSLATLNYVENSPFPFYEKLQRFCIEKTIPSLNKATMWHSKRLKTNIHSYRVNHSSVEVWAPKKKG